jgi:hypothetical protein
VELGERLLDHRGQLVAGANHPRRVPWDGRDRAGRTVAAGVYFSRLTTAEGSCRRRVVKVE